MATKKPVKKTAARKKKHPKMDKKLVSNQPHEIKHEGRKMKTSQKAVRAAKKAVGPSRKKIESELRKTPF